MIDKDKIKQLVNEDISETLHELSKLYYDDPSKLKILLELKRRYDLNCSAWLYRITSPENFAAYNNKIRLTLLKFIDNTEKFTAQEVVYYLDESAASIDLPKLELELILLQVHQNSASTRASSVHFDISWDFKFVIHNNSKFPAYNVKLEFPDLQLTEIDISKLNEYKVIPAEAVIELPATYKAIITKSTKEAGAFLENLPSSFPDAMQYMEIFFHYKNKANTLLTNHFTVVDGKGYNEIIARASN